MVRQRSAKPLFIGSIPIAASNINTIDITVETRLRAIDMIAHFAFVCHAYVLASLVSRTQHF